MTMTRIDRGSTDDDDHLLGRRRPRVRAHLRRATRAGLAGLHRSRARAALVGPARHDDHRRRDGRPPGGKWRYVSSAPDRDDVAFFGEYLEIDPPEGFEWTFMFDVEGIGPQGGPETHTFEDLGGRTTVTSGRAHGLARESSTAPSRPAWSRARSRPGIGSRRCSPRADRSRQDAGHPMRGVPGSFARVVGAYRLKRSHRRDVLLGRADDLRRRVESGGLAFAQRQPQDLLHPAGPDDRRQADGHVTKPVRLAAEDARHGEDGPLVADDGLNDFGPVPRRPRSTSRPCAR